MTQRKAILRGATNQVLDELDPDDIPDLSAAYDAAGTAAAAVATHAGLGDPHTGYRLESADHSHATTGLQGGTIAHSATTGQTATDHHAAPAAGPDANATIDSAGAAGTASTFARSGHGHQVVTDSGVASTQAFGDSATAGTSGTIQRQGHKHAWPALGTTAAAIGTSAGGAATTPSKSDHVHATGAGTPSTQAIGDAAATGSGPAAAMTDHKHAMPAFGTGPAAVGTQANGSSANIARIDHVHATGAGTPSTQALGDAAATGTGPAAAMTDHKHAMPTKADLYSQNALGTADNAIANTETVVVARTFAADELTAGMAYKFEAYFTKAGTNSSAPVIRIRIGTTTLTGTIMGTLTPPAQAVASPGKIEGVLRIVSAGAGGTARGDLEFRLHLGAVTLTAAINPATATGAVNTTTANQRVELTFISGNAANTYTFRNSVMYRVA